MKKTAALILTLSLVTISLSGCGETENNNETQQDMNRQSQEENFEVSAEAVHNKIANNESLNLIDVRTPEEYNEKHISASTLVPLDTLSTAIGTLENLDKTDEIIVYCRSGNRSKTAYDILTQMGYTNVKSMAGGINEWTSLGYNVCLGTSLTC